jgi:hypothetical protein
MTPFDSGFPALRSRAISPLPSSRTPLPASVGAETSMSPWATLRLLRGIQSTPRRTLPKALLANAQHETTNDALFRLDHLAAHLDRLGRAVADLDQDRRLEVAALHIVLDAIAVFARREL